MEVNQKELAQCLGISARQVRNLKAEGMFQAGENGRGYILEKCVQEYINFKVNAETGRSAMLSKEQIQAKHEEVKRQISILKLRKLRREVHEAADVEAFLTDMLMRFRKRLMSVPAKAAMAIAGEDDINKIIKEMSDGISEALEELSGYDPDRIDGMQAGSLDAEDEEGEEEAEEEGVEG